MKAPNNFSPKAKRQIAELERRVQSLEAKVRASAHVQDALEVSETRFRLAFQTSPDGISLTRASDGQLVDTNQGFTDLTGWTHDEAIGRTTADLQLWADQAVREAMANSLRAAGKVDNLEAAFRHKDGHIRWALFSARPLLLNGELHLLSIARDIDDLRDAQQEAERLQAALTKAERLEEMGRVASGVAHDFNNMLTVIRGFAGLLAANHADDDSLQDILVIDRAAQRAGVLTQRLLAFGRSQVLEPVSVQLQAVLEEMQPMIRGLLPESMALRTQIEPEAWPIDADPAQLERVVANLVVNARDAMDQDGVLTLSLRNVQTGNAELVVLEVRDNGKGMDQATLAQVFEPFFTTKPAGIGSGLGLSAVEGIVQQSGGVVEIESAVNSGTVVRISFPRGVELERAKPGATGAQPTHLGARVLLAEDDEQLRVLLERILLGAGYQLTTAKDGITALSAWTHEAPPDLLLTDIVMPSQNGPELAHALRQRWPSLRVAFMSGYAAPEARAKLKLDANTIILRKPFKPSELLDALSALLHSPKPGEETLSV